MLGGTLSVHCRFIPLWTVILQGNVKDNRAHRLVVGTSRRGRQVVGSSPTSARHIVQSAWSCILLPGSLHLADNSWLADLETASNASTSNRKVRASPRQPRRTRAKSSATTSPVMVLGGPSLSNSSPGRQSEIPSPGLDGVSTFCVLFFLLDPVSSNGVFFDTHTGCPDANHNSATRN